MSWLELSDLPLLEAIGVLDGGGGGVNWLLLDRFVTDLAAGAFDGSAAEPGPGTRDSDGLPSISGGTLLIPNGSDAGFSDAIPRIAGTAFFSTKRDIQISALMTALGTAPLTAGGAGGLYLQSTYKFGGGSGTIVMGTPANGSRLAILVRSTGYFFLYSADGTIPSILLWIERTATNNPIYACFHSYGNTHARDDCGVVVLPTDDATLYPIPVLSDSFNRTDGALGSTDGTAHIEGQTTPQGNGVAYSNAATWTISSNVATNTPSVAADNLCYADGGNTEVFHTAEITRSAGECGIVLNVADTNNYLRVVHDGTNVITTEVIAGTPNVLSTVAAAYAAGARLSARRAGNAVRIFYNALFIVELTPNVALQSNTSHGLYSDSSGNTFDNLETWPTTGYNYGNYS